ncbi:hypothetical protein [Thalassomonas haliotis]|uniref:Uncharacterized protein n=1 Tax=Thalassomonas haliotis TaxID=485448 RepID=A0ABY7VJM5_9GAMM|nr:hypothetical protein [Thalassomonas haliotis]WDE13955.1 hypothetical protein H3N35_11205 [Thalassomonas haliotis]
MDINLDKFDKSAVAILKHLAAEFPTGKRIDFKSLFTTTPSDDEFDTHRGAITLLRDRKLIVETKSAKFTLSNEGLTMFGIPDIKSHLQTKVNEQ